LEQLHCTLVHRNATAAAPTCEAADAPKPHQQNIQCRQLGEAISTNQQPAALQPVVLFTCHCCRRLLLLLLLCDWLCPLLEPLIAVKHWWFCVG
jgi:hypothetical protein